MKKLLFIDRDGTLIVEPQDTFQVDSLDRLRFLPGVITWLGKISRELEYDLVMVTNQDGVGTKSFPEKDFWKVQDFMMNVLEGEGIRFTEICIDRSFEHEQLPTRKPGTGMLTQYFGTEYDLPHSYVIGDRMTDIMLARNLGSQAILFADSKDRVEDADIATLITKSWESIYTFLKLPPRKATQIRTTNETQIEVTINLDGTGQANIQTGLGFFDHMLEQLAKHSHVDISVKVRGDLYIDEHHTIEDTAITLGEAFASALHTKHGIERYGFCLPMDDALAQVALDFGGRNWIVWDATFKREKIGEMPTEMFFHFFKSFSDAAKCNLHIKADGENEHHKIEAIFKAFAKSIRNAVKRNPESNQVPTTKGVL
ncbi:MAG: bifunctional histidinol-phosphatase/imidazoleglycerol-phosphate dehydratase HisB [Candidatus Kapaibacterium sp.]